MTLIPEGSQSIDLALINNLTARINAVDLCAELRAVAQEAIAFLREKLTEKTNQASQLAIVKLLLEIPSDLDSAIQWIKNAITALVGPAYAVYLQVIQEATAILAAISSLVSAITAAAGRIGSCSITDLTGGALSGLPTIPAP